MPQCNRPCRQQHIVLAGNHIAVCMAETSGSNLDEHLVLSRLGNRDITELNSLGDIGKLKCFHHGIHLQLR